MRASAIARPLARREPPIDGRHHPARLRSAEQQFQIEVGVLAEIRDSIARLHAARDQSVRNLAGARVELLVSGRASFERNRWPLRRETRMHARDVGQRMNALGRSFRRSRCLQRHRHSPCVRQASA